MTVKNTILIWDHNFGLSHGLKMAPHVDIFVMQVQLQQAPENHGKIYEYVNYMIPELEKIMKRENRNIEISIQLRTEENLSNAVQALVFDPKTKISKINGVSLFTHASTTHEGFTETFFRLFDR